MDEAKEPQGLAVINAGMYRTGTASMARAYEILGLRAHHGHDIPADDGTHWGMWEEAAEAMWPDAPGARRGPKLRRARWSREEWDRLLGRKQLSVFSIASCGTGPSLRSPVTLLFPRLFGGPLPAGGKGLRGRMLVRNPVISKY